MIAHRIPAHRHKAVGVRAGRETGEPVIADTEVFSQEIQHRDLIGRIILTYRKCIVRAYRGVVRDEAGHQWVSRPPSHLLRHGFALVKRIHRYSRIGSWLWRIFSAVLEIAVAFAPRVFDTDDVGTVV